MIRSSSSVYADAHRRAAASAREAERKRILAILALPEARSRWSFAIWISTMTDATVEEARHRLLADGIAGGTPTKPASTLLAGMRERFAGAPPSAATSTIARPAADLGTSRGLVAGMRERFAKGSSNA